MTLKNDSEYKAKEFSETDVLSYLNQDSEKFNQATKLEIIGIGGESKIFRIIQKNILNEEALS